MDDKLILDYQLEAFGPNFVGACFSGYETTWPASMEIQEWLKIKKYMLVIQGDPGVGKTYFCSCLLDYFLGDGRYMTAENLLKKVKYFIQLNRDYAGELSLICESSFFVLDDIGSERPTEFSKTVINQFVDQRWALGSEAGTVITTNYTQQQILDIYGPRTESRLFDKKNTFFKIENQRDLRKS